MDSRISGELRSPVSRKLPSIISIVHECKISTKSQNFLSLSPCVNVMNEELLLALAYCYSHLPNIREQVLCSLSLTLFRDKSRPSHITYQSSTILPCSIIFPPISTRTDHRHVKLCSTGKPHSPPPTDPHSPSRRQHRPILPHPPNHHNPSVPKCNPPR